MKIQKRDLKLIPGEYDQLIKTQPTEIVGELIDENTLFFEPGNSEPAAGYFIMPESFLKDIRRVAKATKFSKSFRTHKGLATQSTVYGVMPRHTFRNDFCRFTKSSYKEKELFAIMNFGCEMACEIYEKYFPLHYKAALKEVQESVPADWRHNETPYLTININVNHAIKYHRDSGNFKGALSTVLILREGISGGELVCPEYGFTLSQRDGAFTLFEGQKVVHGVLPIKREQEGGYRASIVYYSLSDLHNCYPYQDEIKRAQKIATTRNKNKYSLEAKLKLVKQAKGQFKKINSPWLGLLEGESVATIKGKLKKK